MKKNDYRKYKNACKKGSIYESLQGLIIFAIMLVVVIFFFRGCKGISGESSASLGKLADVMTEVNKQDGFSKIISLEIDKDSAIIGYSKDKQMLLTKFKYVSDGQEKIYPDDSEGERVNLDDIFTKNQPLIYVGGAQSIHPYFFGYIKQRPDSCSQRNSCICLCENVFFETKDTSEEKLYKTNNAHMMCKKETCINLEEDIDIKSRIESSEFFSVISDYKIPGQQVTSVTSKDKTFPNPYDVYWEHGFIILRDGFTKKQDSKDVQQSSVGEGPATKLYSINLHHFYAGYMFPYNFKFIDVEVSSKNSITSVRLV